MGPSHNQPMGKDMSPQDMSPQTLVGWIYAFYAITRIFISNRYVLRRREGNPSSNRRRRASRTC